ncbi:type II toxin-antitoxin system PemK/MazF family toxin [Chryseobacterium cheonjiense]|uniref:Type II toxin-antitoxin system PemK/MazF family toxin n=1 Tax=Chryseobacterium cheonjiense TaxID=2728845 RepID=A0A7Y0FGY5_9FLAO|nr:type II toxin-antitoxin system PemK/MazF family toxin [Chryseobacterium cheonjiense]NML55853.1 hypothetical protein [Chryseobacterium cheonjiense]
MSFKRGQIIYHNFILPDKSESDLHPVIILSNESVTDICEMYVGLMITSSDRYAEDLFTFELEEKMILNNKLNKENRFVRLQLIAYFSCKTAQSDVKGTVKDIYMDLILDTQRERVFNEEI